MRSLLFSFIFSLTVVAQAQQPCLELVGVVEHAPYAGTVWDGLVQSGDNLGRDIAQIGDINGDGIQDLAVTANYDDNGGSNAGAVYICFMNALNGIDSVQKIGENIGGFTQNLSALDNFGSSVRGFGDLNYDGVPDIVVGAFHDGDGGYQKGAIYVVYLNTNGTVNGYKKISSSTTNAPSIAVGAKFGRDFLQLGDINNDGFEEWAVSASWSAEGGTERGCIYLLSLDDVQGIVSSKKISHTTNTFSANTEDGMRFGASIDTIGDLDQNGVVDLIVSAPKMDSPGPNDGALFLLYLDTSGSVINYVKYDDSSLGLTGALYSGGQFGASTRVIGHYDDDDIPEILVGNWKSSVNSTRDGASFILSIDTAGTVNYFYEFSHNNSAFSSYLNGNDQFGFGNSFVRYDEDSSQLILSVTARNSSNAGSEMGAFYILTFNDTCASDSIPDSTVAGIERTHLPAINSTDVTVYPNPTNSDNINVIVQGGAGENAVKIFATSGRLISSFNENSNTFTINLKEEPAGVYLLVIQNDQGIAVERFLKSHD